jgi:hypothetical protein
VNRPVLPLASSCLPVTQCGPWVQTDDPKTRGRPGPHGIPLTVHAKAGGAEAHAVVEYLETLDAT